MNPNTFSKIVNRFPWGGKRDLNTAQIFRQVVMYHREQIRFYCYLARTTPTCRAHMMQEARKQASEIRRTIQDWQFSA